MAIMSPWILFWSCIVVNAFGNVRSAPVVLPCTSPTSRCGQPRVQPASFRIIGGQESQVGSWPWMVSLVELGYHVCGGAIISDRFILTAGHCLTGESNDTHRWQILAGKHDLLRLELGQKVLQVKQFIFHEEFDNVTVVNDIALIELTESLTYTNLIQPICLPSIDEGVITGEGCLLAGWGVTRSTGQWNILNQVMLPIIADETCSRPDWYWTDFNGNTTFCAGYEREGRDGCDGDSGGPLICKRQDKWVVQGISSWGYGCAEYKWPGIYTEVTKYIDWIVEKIELNSSCDDIVGKRR